MKAFTNICKSEWFVAPWNRGRRYIYLSHLVGMKLSIGFSIVNSVNQRIKLEVDSPKYWRM